MQNTESKFSQKHFLGKLLSSYWALLLGIVITVGFIHFYDNGLRNVAIVTGWWLFCTVLFQLFYQNKKFKLILLRKRDWRLAAYIAVGILFFFILLFHFTGVMVMNSLNDSFRFLAAIAYVSMVLGVLLVPASIGTGTAWLRAHISVGMLSLFVFMYHVDWGMPNGVFEILLAAAYIGTMVSGIVGIIFYKTVPMRLLDNSEEITFQRIPQHVRLLRKKAENIAIKSIESFEATVIADYYEKHLSYFFVRPFLNWRHLTGISSRVMEDIRSSEILIDRILNKEEQEQVHKLLELAERKNELDYQFTMKFAIKAWVFIHVPFAYAMIIMTIFHVIVVYAYKS